MSYNKAYTRINWENYPSEATPINESNLNNMDGTINTLDNRIVSLDVTKLDVSTANGLVKSVAFTKNTGVFAITHLDDTVETIDTDLEKLAINFDYDEENEKLVITLDDGTTKEVDLSKLITEYNFTNSDTVGITVTDGIVKAEVVKGSITEDYLEPNYLALVKTEVENAKAEVTLATEAKNSALEYATLSESWAVGGTGTRDGEDSDNSKAYSEASKNYRDETEKYKDEAQTMLEEAQKKINDSYFEVDFETGELMFTSSTYDFTINTETGNLEWEVA